MARSIYGLDLGTYEIKVYDKKQDSTWKEKSAIAIVDGKNILAVGDEAYAMFERTPENIQVVFPMKEGVISRFTDMQYLLQNLLKKEHRFARGAEYLISVPTDITEVEKRAFFDLVVHSTAKAKEVNIIERGVAQCVGIGIDVRKTKGVLIVDFGAATTELSIVGSGGMLLNKMLKIGGTTFDVSVMNLIRRKYDFLIGQQTAERIRKRFGISAGKNNTSMVVAGRNLVAGVPRYQEIPSSVVRTAMKESLETILTQIDFLLERTPPEVARAVQENGIYLTGGVAVLPGLARYIEARTGHQVHVAPKPDLCAVEGLHRMTDSKELKQLSYSMLDENYRWIR